MSEGESEEEESEDGLSAGQVQGGSSLSAENLGQSLRQEGKDFGWERCQRWRVRKGREPSRVSPLRPGLSAPLLWLQSSLIRAANDREEDGKCWALGNLGLV